MSDEVLGPGRVPRSWGLFAFGQQILTSMADFEGLLRQLGSAPGLYFIGAGASTGEAPLGGRGFLRDVGLDYLRHATSFAVTPLDHPPLSRLVLDASVDLCAADVGGWGPRDPFDDMTRELLRRVPPNFVRSNIMHHLAKAIHQRRLSHNYIAMRCFHPSLVLNFNHDGLASYLCGDVHRVIPVHGTVEPWAGSPDALAFIRSAGIEYDLAVAPDDLLMMEPESYADMALAKRLMPMIEYKPMFIAIIGYSFAWTGNRHNDQVALDCLADHYRWFDGPVFVIDPEPARIQELLAERLHAAHVIGISARWNLVAHAYVEAIAGRCRRHSLNDYCSQLFDAGHGWTSFPTPDCEKFCS